MARGPWLGTPLSQKEPREWSAGEPAPVPDLSQSIAALIHAEQQALAKELRSLADQIRAAERCEETSDGFNDGVTWALLWIENTANRLTRAQTHP
ncbi:hypothetical protein [Streptomyces albipurpureus]|uniref:Uncharacterized protein n=1 Tax=Streptomyces albipurpureus TaxID=2897419 RepID=A0ABT0UK12_9ACTN|nr:hypothetical protein [Streptomyces sp. CWNU-1]MCM2388984.1 hypothetical protein [Streptomyces sp. CWNU-1]